MDRHLFTTFDLRQLEGHCMQDMWTRYDSLALQALHKIFPIFKQEGTLAIIPSLAWFNEQAKRIGLNYTFVAYPGDEFSSQELTSYLQRREIPISQGRFCVHDSLTHWGLILALADETFAQYFEFGVQTYLANSPNHQYLVDWYEKVTITGLKWALNTNFVHEGYPWTPTKTLEPIFTCYLTENYPEMVEKLEQGMITQLTHFCQKNNDFFFDFKTTKPTH